MPTLRATTGLRPRAAAFLAFLSLSAAPIASPAHPQSTAQNSDPHPTGSARITGRVLVFTFALGPVVPGRYLVAAVPNPGVMFPTERDILERLRPLAVPVTLVSGATVNVEVRVSR